MPGLIAAYFLIRRGVRSSYARSGTPQNLDLDRRLRMGREHGGLTAAIACSAGKLKTTPRRHTGEPRHKTGSRQQLLDAIGTGRPFRQILRDLGLTSNQVWGLTKTDDKWSSQVEAALMGARRDDLQHGTTAAYVAGCVCKDCREHQRQRMGRNR